MQTLAAPAIADEEIDWDAIILEDDTPVDSLDTEQHFGLLTDTLYANFIHSVFGKEFIVAANVGVFRTPTEPPIVPDFFLSLGVRKKNMPRQKRDRSYFIWHVGKPPEVVIEIVSNDEGEEDGAKHARYARLGILYYAIFDPHRILSDVELRLYRLQGRRYVEITEHWMPEIELGLTVWEGPHQGAEGRWLRWCDKTGVVIPTAEEVSISERLRAEAESRRAEEERLRAEEERLRAEEATRRAEEERLRAERLAERLRQLGVTELE
jgi:hypothetical protein